MTTVYVSIGNSDDALSQARWGEYCTVFRRAMELWATQTYGEWYSASDAWWQNACIAIELPPEHVSTLREHLARVRVEFDQDSIAFALVPETDFV